MTDLSKLTLGSNSDPYLSAKQRGWAITDGSALDSDLQLEADVVVVGTGAGGGTAAEILAKAGLNVVLLEEGGLKTSSRFDMKEREAYRDLYQDGALRSTKDASIGIVQGRTVGGSTTVNWTASFRTPPETLKYWAEHMGVTGCSEQELAPHFAQMEQRLGIQPWAADPNPNNAVLQRAANKLGYAWAVIPRNVRGCINSGYCGMGCPVDAKQSMLVTTIPGALDHGAVLVHHAQVERVTFEGDVVTGVSGHAMSAQRTRTGRRFTVRAKHTVLAGGGIGSPAILLRSEVPDPHERIGKRTFLHPTTHSVALYEERINPFYGAPQSIYSDHFQWIDGVSGRCSFKLEVPPLHPMYAAAIRGSRGLELTGDMQQLDHTQAMIALLRDGFHDQSPGGSVELDGEGRPLLDYPISDYLLEGAKRAWHVMAEMQFAAGAQSVRPQHRMARRYTSLAEAKRGIDALPLQPLKAGLGSAHVMGGCAMGSDPERSVTDCDGKLHQLDGLYVMDGSLFPTSIGANPQLSIYGIVHKLAGQLAARAHGRSAG